MINTGTGEFKLDEYQMVICPGLTLSQFRSGDIVIETIVRESNYSGTFTFLGHIDQMRAQFQIEFGQTRLNKLRFTEDVVLYDQNVIDKELITAASEGHDVYLTELKKWTDETDRIRRKQKEKQDAWLNARIGAPPYEYEWGEIISGIEPRDGDVEILVRFRRDFGEDVDLKSYFENRREQERRLAMNPPKPFVRGQLPPGFSPKK